jgi:hypothetical protein
MLYAHSKAEKMLSRDFEAAFTLRLGRKDLGPAVQAAEGADARLAATPSDQVPGSDTRTLERGLAACASGPP